MHAGLDAAMAGHVASRAIPGIVTAVWQGGEMHVRNHGTQSVGGPPIRRDTIFRIASISKPIVAAAAMILVDDGCLQLDAPVESYLPELADRRVLERLDGPLTKTVPAKRPITLRDLLTLRMGMGHILRPDAGDWPIRKALTERGLLMGAPRPADPPDPDEWMRRLGELPLMHQPGEGWMYDIGIDVLGVLLARAADRPLGELLRDRIFDPLGMSDTGFSVLPAKLDRLATEYEPTPDGRLALYDDPADSQWSRPPAFPSASGGLVSTADDLVAFGRMLLGRAVRPRIIASSTVTEMASNQLTSDQLCAGSLILGPNRGWGLGMAVTLTGPATGRFGWDGGLGTSWAVDPAHERVAVLLTQVAWTSPVAPAVCRDFWAALDYAA